MAKKGVATAVSGDTRPPLNPADNGRLFAADAPWNRTAAELVGINTNWVLFMSFAMAAGLGALGGILITPITMTSYDVGIMLGLKGFVAVVVGGLGNGLGAVVGGLLVGVLEAMGAGYISSAYKDAMPFVLILLVLFFMPRGLFGGKSTDRV